MISVLATILHSFADLDNNDIAAEENVGSIEVHEYSYLLILFS